MDYSVGIDLGTTYSAAAIAHGDRLEIFQLGEQAATIPSVVVLRADGEILTGDAAERRALSEPLRTAREFKRRLGDPTPIILGATPYGAESLIGAPAAQHRRPGDGAARRSARPSIVICHPASYSTYKIDLLRQAIRQADIGEVELLTEPEAAALHYALQEQCVGRRGRRGLRLRRGHVRRDDPAQDRGRLRAPRAAGGHGAAGRDRLRRGDLRSTSMTTRARVGRASTQPDRTRRPLPPSRGCGTSAAGRRRPVGRHRRVDPGLPARRPDGGPTHPRGVRVDDPAADPRDDRGARAGGAERGLAFADVDRTLLVGGTSRIPLVAEMVREATGRPIALDAHPKHTMALGAAWVAEQHRLLAASGAEPVVAAGRRARAGPPRRATERPRQRSPPRSPPRPTLPRMNPCRPWWAAVPAPPAPPDASSTFCPRPGRRTARSDAAPSAGWNDGRRTGADRGAGGRGVRLLAPRYRGWRCAAQREPFGRRRGVPRLRLRLRRRRPLPRRTPTPSPSPTATPPPTPSPSPTIPPGRQARITGITLDGVDLRRRLRDVRIQPRPARPARALLLRHRPTDPGRVPGKRPVVPVRRPGALPGMGHGGPPGQGRAAVHPGGERRPLGRPGDRQLLGPPG